MKIKLFSILLLLVLTVSCKFSNEQKSVEDPTATEEVVAEETVESTVAPVEVVEAVQFSKDGKVIGGFDLSPISVNANGTKYTYKDKKGKHKYFADGLMKYEVKFKPEGFKLRDSNSNLLWKIKIYPDKIKISDNEENQNPFIIRNKETDVKIEKNDQEVYRVKFDGNNIQANDATIYTLNNAPDKYVYALMAINEIPEEHRLFILAELLNQL